MDAADWDARYRETTQMWSRGPNVFVAERLADAAPGRAIDLAGGEGRNAVWLAERGWDVELVEFSRVALDRAVDRADEAGVRLTTTHADVTSEPALERADLVLIAYLQLPSAQMARVCAYAASLVGHGGRLLLVGHARRNLLEGFGGPSDPDVLHDPASLASWFSTAGLTVDEASEVTRRVDSDHGPQTAIDVLVDAHR